MGKDHHAEQVVAPQGSDGATGNHSAVKPAGFVCIGHGGYIQCIDPDRLDLIAEARRGEQEMLGGAL